MSAWIFSSSTGTGIGRTGEAGISQTDIMVRGTPSGPSGCLALCTAYGRGSAAFHDTSACPTVRSIRIGGPGKKSATGAGAVKTDMKQEGGENTKSVVTTMSTVMIENTGNT